MQGLHSPTSPEEESSRLSNPVWTENTRTAHTRSSPTASRNFADPRTSRISKPLNRPSRRTSYQWSTLVARALAKFSSRQRRRKRQLICQYLSCALRPTSRRPQACLMIRAPRAGKRRLTRVPANHGEFLSMTQFIVSLTNCEHEAQLHAETFHYRGRCR